MIQPDWLADIYTPARWAAQTALFPAMLVLQPPFIDREYGPEPAK
jgi:hypothetical protein